MTNHIAAEALTTFEVNTDGSRLRLNGEDADGAAISLDLPAECLSQMVMTLPRMAQTALQRQHRDETLRIVYPAATWTIERGQGANGAFILTLKMPDGFEVSFGLSDAARSNLEHAIRDAGAAEDPGIRVN